MKAEIKITDITHDDLVNLLSAASCGSSWLGLNYDSIEYFELSQEQKYGDNCVEDKMASLLLAGKSVELYDMYSESEEDFYGTLPHHYDDEGDMFYTVTLKDIKKGLESAYTDSYGRKCINDLIDDGYDLDLPEAEYLIQIILFGEELYG
jgi:hypothetical protein